MKEIDEKAETGRGNKVQWFVVIYSDVAIQWWWCFRGISKKGSRGGEGAIRQQSQASKENMTTLLQSRLCFQLCKLYVPGILNGPISVPDQQHSAWVHIKLWSRLWWLALYTITANPIWSCPNNKTLTSCLWHHDWQPRDKTACLAVW